ncbi:MAG TPA: YciI family protein [Acidimicrobiales bacterium]
MLLIYNNPSVYESWSEEDRNAVFAEVDSLMAELTESGEWLGGEALMDAARAKTVRVRDGVPVVTDGPFVEAKEQFAGYLAVDCESIDRAVEIAARWPDAKHFAMEVRPLVEQEQE